MTSDNDSDIGGSTMEPSFKESCRKDCSDSRRREEKVDFVDTHRGVTCKAASCYHARATNSKSSLEMIRYDNSRNSSAELVSGEERDAAKSEIRSDDDRKRENRYKTHINACDDSKDSVIEQPGVALRKDAMKDETSERAAVTGQNTYRCYSTILPDIALSLETSTTRSLVISSGTTARVERRCKIDARSIALEEDAWQNEAVRRERYIVDNHRQVVRISTTSLSDPDVSDCQMSSESDLARRNAHSEWVRRKHEAAQRRREDEERAMRKRQEEEEKMARKKDERARLEKQNFLKWMEGKRRQEFDRKAMFQNELESQKQLKEIENKTAEVEKALYLRQWIRKKKEEQKTRHKEQESKQRKINEEREKRLEQCSKAYEKWRQNSKNRPKPATQGLLPHQKAKPAYVNPIPWQPIVEIDSDETQEDASNDENRHVNQLKMNSARTVMAYQ